MNNIERISYHLPQKLMRQIRRAANFSRENLSEIHITRGNGSSVRFAARRTYLGVSVFQSDIDAILLSFTGGALYAYRDSLREGYLTVDGGIRVGVCGQARYEKGTLVGISEVSSLLIRLPSEECSFTNELCEAFYKCEKGMLIFAPAAGGKTTALRALVRRLAELRAGRISVIDERMEIGCEAFEALDVDIFKGYKRAEGMQIALRVMSPEILAVDELGVSRESIDMLDSLFSGVKFIATAHASSLEEVKKRKNLSVFFELDIFDIFVKIFHTDKGFGCEIC